jgi:hypothetical protein
MISLPLPSFLHRCAFSFHEAYDHVWYGNCHGRVLPLDYIIQALRKSEGRQFCCSQIAATVNELMIKLGYTRYVAQGDMMSCTLVILYYIF